MFKKDSCLLFFFFLIALVSLTLALIPTSDFDQDGAFDSLLTEGLLLLPLICFVTRNVRRDQFPVARLASPRSISKTLRHPPISA